VELVDLGRQNRAPAAREDAEVGLRFNQSVEGWLVFIAIVVVLEPFAPDEVGSTRARQLEARIKRLGREYKRDHGGATDFESAYMKKYR